MTTAAHPPSPGPRPGPAGRAVLVPLAAVGAVAAAAVALGAVLGGAPAAAGALLGAGLVAGFFGLGALLLDLATRLAPAASLLLALLTYLLKVVALAAVFVALQRSGALAGPLDARWLAGTVIAGTVAWVAAQLAVSVRARIPAFDLPAPSPATGAPPPAAGARRPEAGAR